VRKSLNDESSISESVVVADPAPSVGSYGETVEITALLALDDLDIILVGKDDGEVCICDSRTGQQSRVLYKHGRDLLVTHLGWNSTHNQVVSVDAASRILVWNMVQNHEDNGAWKTSSLAYNLQADSSVEQVAFMSGGEQLLVTTASSTMLYQLRDGSASSGAAAPIKLNAEGSKMHYLWRRPATTILPCGSILQVEAGKLGVIDLSDSSQLFVREIGLKTIFPSGEDTEQTAQRVEIDPTGTWLAVQTQQQGLSCPYLLLYSLEHPSLQEAHALHNPALSPIVYLAPTKFKQYLGTYGGKLIFLDTHLWVCSLDLSLCAGDPQDNPDKGTLEARTKLATKRHFPIPYELIGSSNNIPGAVTRHGGICFPRAGELGIVNNGLLSSF